MHNGDLYFASGSSTQSDWRLATQECLAQACGGQADLNLGFIYVTSEHAGNLEAIVSALKASSGISDWVGTTGIGILATGAEWYETPAMALLVGKFPADSYRILPPLIDHVSEVPDELRAWFSGNLTTVGIIHADPQNTHLQHLIPTFSETLDSGFLIGGLTSTTGNEYHQIAGSVTGGGLSGVLFSQNVSIASGLSQGCSPLGPSRTITACHRNLVIEIDDQPALAVLKELAGEPFASDLNRVAGQIFAGLPVAGSDTSDYLVRNLIGIDIEQQIIAIGESIEAGDAIMFCRRDTSSAREDLVRMLRDVRDRLGNRVAKGALYFSCLGRGRHTFGPNAREMAILRDELGDVPLVGFFANGEISHNRLYGYTGVLSVFY